MSLLSISLPKLGWGAFICWVLDLILDDLLLNGTLFLLLLLIFAHLTIKLFKFLKLTYQYYLPVIIGRNHCRGSKRRTQKRLDVIARDKERILDALHQTTLVQPEVQWQLEEHLASFEAQKVLLERRLQHLDTQLTQLNQMAAQVHLLRQLRLAEHLSGISKTWHDTVQGRGNSLRKWAYFTLDKKMASTLAKPFDKKRKETLSALELEIVNLQQSTHLSA